MKPLRAILENAARSNRTIALAEGDDERVIAAALTALRTGVARPQLVGPARAIRAGIRDQGGDPDAFAIHDPEHSELTEEFAEVFYQLRRHKGVSPDAARVEVCNRLHFAGLLVRQGYADGTLGGAVATTSDTVRAALTIIGMKPGSKLVSSFFLMLLCAEHHARKGAVVFSDCGLVVSPSPEELAQIAIDSARSYQMLIGEAPRVAMLSFSTAGSARHELVAKVVEATEIVRSQAPDLPVDGELQFDAAFVPAIAERKAQGSSTAGRANVFIFPNLEAGNIAYKIAERVGNAIAVGPILQGLAKPANDLSRGCSADDVLNMIAVTAAQVDGDAVTDAEAHSTAASG